MSYTSRHVVSMINEFFQGGVMSYFGSSPKEEFPSFHFNIMLLPLCTQSQYFMAVTKKLLFLAMSCFSFLFYLKIHD